MAEKRKRSYQDQFLNYGFTEIEDNGTMKPQCVVCMKVLTSESFKKSQLKKHLDSLHPHLSSKPREYFENLEISAKKQRLNSSWFGAFDQRSASMASFEVAWLIARNKKPYTIGEDCSPLELRSRGIDVYNKVNEYFDAQSLNWKNCISVSLDGAPAMLGHINGFSAFVKKNNPNIEINHCMIHRQALMVKCLEPTLEAVMHDVIKIVNFIKGHALNTRLFRELCQDGEAEYTDLLYHTEVRWLSRGNVLNRVWILKDELEKFMVDRKNILADKFKNPSWVAYLAYLADIFENINILNKKLQGKDINIITAREIVSAFGLKLQYWIQKVEQNKIASFPKLSLFLEDHQNIKFSDIKDVIVNYLIKLKKRFSDYFPDIDSNTISWIVNPFECEIAKIPEEPSGLAEEILELRTNTEAKLKFEIKKNLTSFWMSKAAKAFAIAHEEATNKLLPFGTTYLCEQGFSSLIMNIKTKNRNRLNADDCIQIALTSKNSQF